MKLLKTVKNKLFEEAGLGDGIKPFWKIKQDNLPHEYELLVFFFKDYAIPWNVKVLNIDNNEWLCSAVNLWSTQDIMSI